MDYKIIKLYPLEMVEKICRIIMNHISRAFLKTHELVLESVLEVIGIGPLYNLYMLLMIAVFPGVKRDDHL